MTSRDLTGAKVSSRKKKKKKTESLAFFFSSNNKHFIPRPMNEMFLLNTLSVQIDLVFLFTPVDLYRPWKAKTIDEGYVNY